MDNRRDRAPRRKKDSGADFFKIRVVGPGDEDYAEIVALFNEPDDYELEPFKYHSSLNEVPRLKGYIRPRDRQPE